MKIYTAAYIAMLIHFIRMILSKIIPDGVRRTLWLNLSASNTSVGIHTSCNSAQLSRIRDMMIDEAWTPEALSFVQKYEKALSFADAMQAGIIFPGVARRIREILDKAGCGH